MTAYFIRTETRLINEVGMTENKVRKQDMVIAQSGSRACTALKLIWQLVVSYCLKAGYSIIQLL